MTIKSLLKKYDCVADVTEREPGLYIAYLKGGYSVSFDNSSHTNNCVSSRVKLLANFAARAAFCFCKPCRTLMIETVLKGDAEDYVHEWKKSFDAKVKAGYNPEAEET